MPSPSDADSAAADSGEVPGGVNDPSRGSRRGLQNARAAQQVIGWTGLLGLAAITLASPGATQMYAWPWVLAYWAALLAPVALLILRAVDTRHPWVLPGPGWTALTLAWGGIVLASALASPYRGPSLLWSAPLLAGPALFVVLCDWLHGSPAVAAQLRRRLLLGCGVLLSAVALVSLGLWVADLFHQPDWRSIWLARNGYPLGHSNYTAGLTLLMLPVFSGLALAASGRTRAAWWGAAGIALLLLFTTGSRGGLVGLAVLALAAAPAIARKLQMKLWLVALVGVAACALLFAANPRIREMLASPSDETPPAASNVQRTAMWSAGLRLGGERTLLGWGPGTTPLAFPRVRGALDGGNEDVLQLHSVPVQLWAELGVAGVVVALGGILLGIRSAFRGRADSPVRQAQGPEPVEGVSPPRSNDPSGGLGRLHQVSPSQAESALPAAKPVLLGLGGYLVFSLTDWQFDVPIFAAAAAVGAALLAGPGQIAGSAARRAGVFAPVTILAVCALFGRSDPTPDLNVKALNLALEPNGADQAVALLRESLAQNPEQEIVRFNLGWLLVVRDPPEAERQFIAAARLVPDKGGVWFGLGLARLNQGKTAGAARAFALEGLNDPAFLFSPWWKPADFSALRQKQAAEFLQVFDDAAVALTNRGGWTSREARYVAALAHWSLDRTHVPVAVDSGETRSAYFRRDPLGAELETAPIKGYRRQRTGYPVLMRQPDLPPPSDAFYVQENAAAAGALHFLFPEKGWLPSPLLLELLDQK